MALTDTAIKADKPKDRDYKLFNGGGLYLLVTVAGKSFGASSIALTGLSGRFHWAQTRSVTLGAARRGESGESPRLR